MGYIKHHTIVVTSWKEDDIIDAHNKAIEIFDKRAGSGSLISPIIEGIVNTQSSFFIAPDGSKEGWTESDQCDEARNAYLDWLESTNRVDFVEVMFGGNGSREKIIRSKRRSTC
jgi:hypothetical protein